MSTKLEQLMAKGGQIVGGDLIIRHQVMGQFRNGDFFVTPEGLAELDVIDVVEVKEVAKPAKASKAKKEEAPVEVVEPTDEVTIEV